MAVGIKVGSITDELGTSDFVHAFFSTISANLEKGWGTRFPVLLTKLYRGELNQSDATRALAELSIANGELAKLSPDRVVWDIENPGKQPPWGNDISPDISNLSNYFVTSTGRDLIGVLREAIEALQDDGGTARLVSY